MSLLPDNWVEHCLALCSALPGPPARAGAAYPPETRLWSRTNGGEAVVAFSDPITTTLVFGGTRSVQFPTQHVNRYYL